MRLPVAFDPGERLIQSLDDPVRCLSAPGCRRTYTKQWELLEA